MPGGRVVAAPWLLVAVLGAAVLIAACGRCAFNPDCELSCDGPGISVRVTREPPRVVVAGESMDTVEVFVNARSARQCGLPAPRTGDTVALDVEPSVPLQGETQAVLDDELFARFGGLCLEVPDTGYALRASPRGFDVAGTTRSFIVVAGSSASCPRDP